MQQFLYQHIFHFDVQHPSKTWFKQRHNIIYGIAKLLPLLKTKRYFDVGANIGIHAWLCNQFNVDVFCFEPNSALNRYIELNAKPNKIFNVAIGDYNGTAYLEQKEQSSGNQITQIQTIDNLKVDVKKIDDIVLPPPGIIKFDVEGHEPSAINGASNTIKKFYPWIIVEDKFNKTEIDNTLIKLNYKKHSQWTKDSIWHHDNNLIPIKTITPQLLTKT